MTSFGIIQMSNSPLGEINQRVLTSFSQFTSMFKHQLRSFESKKVSPIISRKIDGLLSKSSVINVEEHLEQTVK